MPARASVWAHLKLVIQHSAIMIDYQSSQNTLQQIQDMRGVRPGAFPGQSSKPKEQELRHHNKALMLLKKMHTGCVLIRVKVACISACNTLVMFRLPGTSTSSNVPSLHEP